MAAITVELSWSEVLQAAQAGIMRRVMALQRKRAQPSGDPKHDVWGIDIEACAAELVVAKSLGLYWHALSNRIHGLADLAGAIEVRCTALENGRLIVTERDSDASPFVLVVGRAPKLKIMGWMFGRDAKQRNWQHRGDGRQENRVTPPYFVPQAALRPMDELRELLGIPGAISGAMLTDV